MTVLLLGATVYVTGVLLLLDTVLRLPPWVRPERWPTLVLGWPWWVTAGAALTAGAKVAMVLRLVDGDRVGGLR